MAEFDASDAHVPDSLLINVAWVDVVNPLTGEVTTIDAVDGGPYGSGETFTIQWSTGGICALDDL